MLYTCLLAVNTVVGTSVFFQATEVWLANKNCMYLRYTTFSITLWYRYDLQRRKPVLEKTVESPLDCKEIKPVSPKGNQPWKFTGRTDAETESLIVWPPDAKSWLFWKDPDAGKDWRQDEKRATENEMVGWLKGHEFEQTLEDNKGQGSLACYNLWGQKELDRSERLKNNNYLSNIM